MNAPATVTDAYVAILGAIDREVIANAENLPWLKVADRLCQVASALVDAPDLPAVAAEPMLASARGMFDRVKLAAGPGIRRRRSGGSGISRSTSGSRGGWWGSRGGWRWRCRDVGRA